MMQFITCYLNPFLNYCRNQYFNVTVMNTYGRFIAILPPYIIAVYTFVLQTLQNAKQSILNIIVRRCNDRNLFVTFLLTISQKYTVFLKGNYMEKLFVFSVQKDWLTNHAVN